MYKTCSDHQAWENRRHEARACGEVDGETKPDLRADELVVKSGCELLGCDEPLHGMMDHGMMETCCVHIEKK